VPLDGVVAGVTVRVQQDHRDFNFSIEVHVVNYRCDCMIYNVKQRMIRVRPSTFEQSSNKNE
jgi:hypothetical protein